MKKHEETETEESAEHGHAKHEKAEKGDKPEAQQQSTEVNPLAGVPSIAVVSLPRLTTGGGTGKTTVTAPTSAGGHVRRVDLGGQGGTINLYIETSDPSVTGTVNIMLVDVNSPAATALPSAPYANFLGSVSDAENSFVFVYSDTLTI